MYTFRTPVTDWERDLVVSPETLAGSANMISVGSAGIRSTEVAAVPQPTAEAAISAIPPTNRNLFMNVTVWRHLCCLPRFDLMGAEPLRSAVRRLRSVHGRILRLLR